MPTQFKIVINKEILAQCKDCGTANDTRLVENNCAIAIALAAIFPEVYVTNRYIFPFGIEGEKDWQIPIPLIAQQFIKLFDGFRLTPRLRLLLPEFEFTIDIPDAVIDQINIDNAKLLIENHSRGYTKSNDKRLNSRQPHRQQIMDAAAG